MSDYSNNRDHWTIQDWKDFVKNGKPDVVLGELNIDSCDFSEEVIRLFIEYGNDSAQLGYELHSYLNQLLEVPAKYARDEYEIDRDAERYLGVA